MRTSFLPNLRGLITNGAHLKIAVTKALNHAMVYAKRGPGYSPAATALYTFLLAAINANRTFTHANTIAVTPTAQAMVNGATAQIAIQAAYPDGVTEAVSASDGRVTYVSSAPAIATVSAVGLITKVSAGAATITTTYQARTATTSIT